VADYAICTGNSSVNTGDYWQWNGQDTPANGVGILWNGNMGTTPPVLPGGPTFKVTPLREITDGTSHTLMVGEKYLNPDNYEDGTDLGDNETVAMGFNGDTARWTIVTPLQDRPSLDYDWTAFGSAS
jgi:hypothetical protein